jgi:hypothetical protein
MALIKINNRSSEDTAIHGRRNLIINGAMNVAQRGTSFTGITSTIAYRMDRWQVGFGAAGSNYSITQSTDAPDNFKYSIKWQRTASNAVTNSIWFSQAFESVNSKVVAGKTCTLSYYAKKGANYSATSSDIQVRIISGTGTDQSATSAITAGWTGYATPLSTTQVITSSWVRYTHTVTFASNINQISVNLASNSAGTAGADDSLQITGVQLEVGDQATPFEHLSYAEELSLCSRYYHTSFSGETTIGGSHPASYSGKVFSWCDQYGSSPDRVAFNYQWPVQMRDIPTVTMYGNQWTSARMSKYNGGSAEYTIDYVSGISRNGLGGYYDVAGTNGDFVVAYVEASAEL